MNFYRIEAYDTTHSGRTRTGYQMAKSAAGAARAFEARYPDRVIRCMWKLMASSAWATDPPAAMPETDPNNHLTDNQEDTP